MVLQQIWLYGIIGGTLPMCQNTTMRINGAWINSYCVLCSKHIIPCTVVITSLLVRDKPLVYWAQVKAALVHCKVYLIISCWTGCLRSPRKFPYFVSQNNRQQRPSDQHSLVISPPRKWWIDVLLTLIQGSLLSVNSAKIIEWGHRNESSMTILILSPIACFSHL